MQEFVRGDTFAFKFKLTIQDKVAIQKEDIDTLFITCRRYASKEFPVVFEKTLDIIPETERKRPCPAGMGISAISVRRGSVRRWL